jgi:hypothetical protein
LVEAFHHARAGRQFGHHFAGGILFAVSSGIGRARK